MENTEVKGLDAVHCDVLTNKGVKTTTMHIHYIIFHQLAPRIGF
jgi:hypothetical protein